MNMGKIVGYRLIKNIHILPIGTILRRNSDGTWGGVDSDGNVRIFPEKHVQDTELFKPIWEEFIVAEVSKNWNSSGSEVPISKSFEDVININAARGYKLVDWKFTSVCTGGDRDNILETIIAIFKLED